jgi:hypothetical protein
MSKVYNMEIEKVNTARFMGKVYRGADRNPHITKAFKKVFIMTKHKIDPFLNS